MAVQIAPTQKFNQSYLQTKRVLDVLCALLILVPLCIVFVFVAVLIRFDSAGPIFFRQRRVGLNGVEFYMLKFRTMCVNSDDSIHREAIAKYMNNQNLSDNITPDLLYKQVGDPRVTRVGRFLRKTSIDELPQFFNVLWGEMTLVGPRPPLPYEVERYSSHDRLRLSGKPGLTGPWQVYGRSRVPFQTMVEMDIAYLQRQSLREDLKLIALTVPVMIQGRGGA
jgi:lipopolysaccharide/colanic/teichoic acid biosynthesis glycosyltransferase